MQQNNLNINKNTNILPLLTFFIESYINAKNAANLSKNTINNITRVLDRFYDYIAGEYANHNNLTIFDINKYFLGSYLNFLTISKISKNTQKLHLSIIKNFLLFIGDYDIGNFGAIRAQIKGLTIKTEQREKKSFIENEQKQLKLYLARLDAKKCFLAHRNSLLIKILLYTGARVSEVLNIKWQDLSELDDPEHGVVYAILLKGKGNKERYTYMLYSEIEENVKFLREYAKNKEFLISSTHGNQVNRSVAWTVIKHQLSIAGINKTGLHIFRHTCARNLVSKNINLSTIKEILGHSNITVTAQFYAKTNEASKKDALINIK